jgi:hypothetical protein
MHFNIFPGQHYRQTEILYNRTTAVSCIEQGEKLTPSSIISPATRRCFSRRVVQYSARDYSEIYVFGAVYCNAIIQYKPTKCTFSKLIF